MYVRYRLTFITSDIRYQYAPLYQQREMTLRNDYVVVWLGFPKDLLHDNFR